MSTGTCYVCKQPRAVDSKGRTIEHERTVWHGEIQTCGGSGTASVERRAINKARADAARARGVERMRETAAVAMDAVLTGSPLFDDKIDKLLDLALVDYRLKFPKSRARNLWFFYDGKKTRKIRLRDRVDVYCTFCRAILVARAAHGYDYSARLRHHTVPCALAHLAGILKPAEPGTVRLPAEFVQDDA